MTNSRLILSANTASQKESHVWCNNWSILSTDKLCTLEALKTS